MSMKGKKGLSGIVTILIVILLGLVAAGVVWVVINNTVSQSAGKVEYSTSCLEISLNPTKIQNTSVNDYKVTIKRSSSKGDIEGIRFIFYDSNEENTEIIDVADPISPSATKTYEVSLSDFESPSRVEVHAYFMTEKGDEYVCEGSNSYKISSSSSSSSGDDGGCSSNDDCESGIECNTATGDCCVSDSPYFNENTETCVDYVLLDYGTISSVYDPWYATNDVVNIDTSDDNEDGSIYNGEDMCFNDGDEIGECFTISDGQVGNTWDGLIEYYFKLNTADVQAGDSFEIREVV